MMATINIAALLQHGADDSILANAASSTSSQQEEASGSRRTRKGEAKVPTAIMLSNNKSGSPPSSPRLEEKSAPATESEQSANILQLQNGTTAAPAHEDYPIQLKYTLKLAFAMLDAFCNSSRKSGSLNPYITIMLTFLSTVAKQLAALSILERWVPWSKIVSLASDAPHSVDPRKDLPSKISSAAPLPEDWCLRGMAWVGRRVYERGFWRSQRGSPGLHFESEIDVLTREDHLGDSDWAGESLDIGKEDTQSAGPGTEEFLQDLRWKRVAYCCGNLAKVVPGLDYDPRRRTLTTAEPLRSKLQRWKAEEQKEAEEARKGKQNNKKVEQSHTDSDDMSADEDDSDDEDDPDLPEDVRQLKVGTDSRPVAT